jgi:2-(1,2-epoxy-1,2-dihydrophenyl)acetyl-CoA isomerase
MISGEGKAFCSGGDVKSFGEILKNPDPTVRRLPDKLHQMIVALRRLPKPVLAAVNGVTAGAGFSLVMACDIAVASDKAYFNLAYCRIGLSPDGSSTFFLPRLLGPQRALYYMYTGENLPVEEAKRAGIVQEVYADGEFREKAWAMAQRLAQGPTRAMAVAKRLVTQSFNTSLEAQVADETDGICEVWESKDFTEGVMSFIEKRPPQFKGR